MDLEKLLRNKRLIRVIGFDDAPFIRHTPEPVAVAGVVCAGTRFEGMLWSHLTADGWDATDIISEMVLNSKFFAQLHVVLLDGVSFGGLNIVDLPELAKRLNRPCVSVMRRYPDLNAIAEAMARLPELERRLDILSRAGEIHKYSPFYYQVCGADPELIAKVLTRLTDCGKVPEALRIAHLITSAVIKGESGKQA